MGFLESYLLRRELFIYAFFKLDRGSVGDRGPYDRRVDLSRFLKGYTLRRASKTL